MRFDDAVERIGRAYELRYAQQFSAALRELETVLELPIPPPTALLLAAECLQKVDSADPARVEELLRKAIALAPDYVDAKLELGHLINLDDDRAEEARAVLEQARKLIDDLEHSAVLLDGWSLFSLDRSEEAIPFVTQAIARFPKSQNLRSLLETLEASAEGDALRNSRRRD